MGAFNNYIKAVPPLGAFIGALFVGGLLAFTLPNKLGIYLLMVILLYVFISKSAELSTLFDQLRGIQ